MPTFSCMDYAHQGHLPWCTACCLMTPMIHHGISATGEIVVHLGNGDRSTEQNGSRKHPHYNIQKTPWWHIQIKYLSFSWKFSFQFFTKKSNIFCGEKNPHFLDQLYFICFLYYWTVNSLEQSLCLRILLSNVSQSMIVILIRASGH